MATVTYVGVQPNLCNFFLYCRTAKQGCPAFVMLTLSSDGQALEVKELISEHNHEVSKVYCSFSN